MKEAKQHTHKEQQKRNKTTNTHYLHLYKEQGLAAWIF